jgi:hypothetical protein
MGGLALHREIKALSGDEDIDYRTQWMNKANICSTGRYPLAAETFLDKRFQPGTGATFRPPQANSPSPALYPPKN